MAALNANNILQIWEWGQGKTPLEQAVTILAVAYPDLAPEQLMAWPIGQRDAHLLALREATLGAHLNGQARCPQCQEQLEFQLEVEALKQESVLPPTAASDDTSYFTEYIEDYTLQLRLPTSQDLWALVNQSADTARQQLLRQCCQSVIHQNRPIAPTDLPDAVLTELNQRLAARDPQAEVLLELSCAACGHHWSSLFDIATFFWHELAAQAQRLLEEVHWLASTYGWRETDILAMSPWRRQAYLERIWQ